MSALTVKREIIRATENDPPSGCLAGATIDDADANRILSAAAPRPTSLVSKAEKKLITDLYDRQVPAFDPGHMMTMACPEYPGLVTFTPGADHAFNVFFSRHDIPRGELLVDRLREMTSNLGYGPALDRWPDLSGHVRVFLHDKRPADGDRAEAFVNFTDGVYYVMSTGAGMGGPDTIGPHIYGPNRLDAGLSREGRQRILDAFAREQPSFVYENPFPIGVQLYRTELMKERHPDGFQYTALIPIGALTPGGAPSDPDDAACFYVERSGGVTGRPAYAGPIDLGPGFAMGA